MTNDWLVRVGDGSNLVNSSPYGIWGINSTTPTNKYFLKNIQPGDRLWFVKSKSKGKLIAVATYQSYNMREFGLLLDLSMTNEELGWTGDGVDWTSDAEIHYINLYGLIDCELLTEIKGPSTTRKYDEKCKVNLPVQYTNIVRYSRVTNQL